MTVGASIGISQFPADGTSAEELLLNADAAMYGAKAAGECVWLSYQDLRAVHRSRTQQEAGRQGKDAGVMQASGDADLIA